MPKRASSTPATPLPVPEIDGDAPVAVIPVASAAPLDGPPDGERLNTFTLEEKADDWVEDSAVTALGEMRDHVLSKPLTYVAAAFSLGFLVSRLLR